MGETFEILASDVKKIVIFQRIGGPCRDRTYDQLIKRHARAACRESEIPINVSALHPLVLHNFL